MPIVTDNQTPSDITKYATPFYLLQWALQFNEAGTCYEITLGNVTETLVFSNESITFNTCTLLWTWWLKNRNPNKDTHFNNEIHICIFYNKMDIVNDHWMNPKQITKLNNYFFQNVHTMRLLSFKPLGPIILRYCTVLDPCLIERTTTAGNFIVAAALISQLKRGDIQITWAACISHMVQHKGIPYFWPIIQGTKFSFPSDF